jgi:phosphoribosylformylglycinamidine synthase
LLILRLLRETFEPELLKADSIFDSDTPTQTVVEVGPRLNFSTAWSTNATSICTSVGLGKVSRLEQSMRFLLTSTRPLSPEEVHAFAAMVHDRMTEQVYEEPITSFKVNTPPAPVYTVAVMEKGRKALEEINEVSQRVLVPWVLGSFGGLWFCGCLASVGLKPCIG